MNIIRCYPGGKQKALTLSYDDGVWPDQKLVSIMREYGVSGTFNLNSVRRPVSDRVDQDGNQDFRMEPEEIGNLYEGFEIAAHSCTHPFLDQLPERKICEELFYDRENLTKRYGRPVVGLALPFGAHNETVDRIIRKLGFLYCRTIVSTHKFTPPDHLPFLDPTCRHREPELMDLGRAFLETDQELALFYLWGHSFEFELSDDWNVIEDFLRLVSRREDVYYGTNGEIISYLNSMDRLIMEEDFLLNPTGQDLWVRCQEKILKVPGGQWVNLSL